MKFLALLLMMLNAHAGVQGVGKGGGFGEMQAYSANITMGRQVSACVKSPAVCEFTFQEASLIERAAMASVDLQFDPTCRQSGVEVLSSRQVRISSCELYQVGPHPKVKSFSEIAALVLQARLMATQSLDSTNSSRLAQTVFRDVAQDLESISVQLVFGNFFFHTLKVQTRASSETFVSLEGKTTTVDLSGHVLSALDCREPSAVQLDFADVQVLSENQAVALGRIEWDCSASGSFAGELQVYFTARQDEEVEAGALQARIVKRVRR